MASIPVESVPAVPSTESVRPGPGTSRSFWTPDAMHGVALRMLTGDRAKYLGLIFAIAFSSFLIAQQACFFFGVLDRTRSLILDVSDADIWVMDSATPYVDEIFPLRDGALYQVRGVEGVQWAVPLFKGQAVARAGGRFRNVHLVGVDDASLAGLPRKTLLGSIENLRDPDAVMVDLAGYHVLFPGQPAALGQVLEMNDHRARIVAICEASAPFVTLPIMFTRYTQAVNFVGRQRNQLSFLLVKAKPGQIQDVAAKITAATGLKAMPRGDFGWQTVGYYMKSTGIPINFGLTVAIGLIVGMVIAGQTFYIFTVENLKHFAALKAIGATNGRLVGMILLQAITVGAMGYSLGMGLTGLFFFAISFSEATRGLVLIWQVLAGAGMMMLLIVALASLMSIRKVLRLEPAMVFRG